MSTYWRIGLQSIPLIVIMTLAACAPRDVEIYPHDEVAKGALTLALVVERDSIGNPIPGWETIGDECTIAAGESYTVHSVTNEEEVANTLLWTIRKYQIEYATADGGCAGFFRR